MGNFIDIYDDYYKKLKNFYSVNSPDTISSETKAIKQEFKAIKDLLFELEGHSADIVEDIVTETAKSNKKWNIYTDDALIPATRKVPNLKALLERRTKLEKSPDILVPNEKNYYGYNGGFEVYLRGEEPISTSVTTLDPTINKLIKEIRKLAQADGIEKSMPVPVIQPEYAVKPIMPIQSLYAAPTRPDPIVQPAYGVKPTPKPIGDQPLYAAPTPIRKPPVEQALYAVPNNSKATGVEIDKNKKILYEK